MFGSCSPLPGRLAQGEEFKKHDVLVGKGIGWIIADYMFHDKLVDMPTNRPTAKLAKLYEPVLAAADAGGKHFTTPPSGWTPPEWAGCGFYTADGFSLGGALGKKMRQSACASFTSLRSSLPLTVSFARLIAIPVDAMVLSM